MEIVCDGCRARFRIPDGKIPVGKTAQVTCPKCQSRFSVRAPRPGEGLDIADFFEEGSDTTVSGKTPSVPQASETSAFAFIEEEGEVALLCEPDAEVRQRLKEILEYMEYHVVVANAPHEALKTMRLSTCHVVVVNETFGDQGPDANGVLLYLERLAMATRRDMFVVMLSHHLRSMDSMAAFIRSVNLVVNIGHVENFERLLKQGLGEHHNFYEVFLDAMKDAGWR